ncbi:MAG: DJ-1/PfpI family protein [Nitrospinaceae bacterium]|nr:DJ-1/PfpI family protein [Nitrospinaceae bacterium]
MGRLTGKNILIIIPKDYYDEEELEIPYELFKSEDANIIIASGKMKEAVGIKTGRRMPDRLIVDSMEGITGDSYVTGGTGTRQIKAVFQGVVVVGGSGARNYLWEDKMVRLLLTDRYKSEFVVAAIGQGIGCLAEANLVEALEVPVDENTAKKPFLKILDKGKALLSDEDLIVYERLVIGKDSSIAKAFAEAVVDEVEKITKIK